MRLHRPWNVPIHMPRVFTGVIAESRVSISFAALLVNVTARIDSGDRLPGREQPRDARRQHARLAAAGAGEDQRRPCGSVTAASCSGLRSARRGEDMDYGCARRDARCAPVRVIIGGVYSVPDRGGGIIAPHFHPFRRQPTMPTHSERRAHRAFRDHARVRAMDPAGGAVHPCLPGQDVRHRVRRRGRRRRHLSRRHPRSQSAAQPRHHGSSSCTDRGRRSKRSSSSRTSRAAITRACASPTPRRWTACWRPRARSRSRIEALLSLGIANSPMAGARNRVSSGNYITAKPIGVRRRRRHAADRRSAPRSTSRRSSSASTTATSC